MVIPQNGDFTKLDRFHVFDDFDIKNISDSIFTTFQVSFAHNALEQNELTYSCWQPVTVPRNRHFAKLPFFFWSQTHSTEMFILQVMENIFFDNRPLKVR